MFNIPVEQWIGRALDEALRWSYAHTLGLLDPFFAYSVEVAMIVAACFCVGWFFPAVRSFFGAVAVAAITFLVAFRKGENAARQFDKKKPRRK